MPTAHTSINTEKRITPPAPAWAPPTLNWPSMITATISPPPISTAISTAILSDQGRSPGSSGVSVARTAALRSSDVRRGRGAWAGAASGACGGRGAVATGADPGGRRRPRLRLLR